MTQKLPIFFAAPHRVMFAAGCIQSVLSMLLWTIDLGARYGGLWPAPLWPMPPLSVHATLMIYGLLAFFIFGFLFTAGPRWQGYGELRQGEFLPPFLLMVAGWLVFYLGLIVGQGATAGLLCVLAGWLMAWWVVVRIARTPSADRRHIVAEAVAVGAGAVGLGLAVIGFGLGDFRFHGYSVAVGIWAFLLPAFFTVEHRMVPVFSAIAAPGRSLTSPAWALWLIWAASLAHGLCDLTGAAAWRWLADLPAAMACLFLSRHWCFGCVLRIPLVAVLHGAFAWLGVAFLLFAVQSMLDMWGVHALGLGPLHVLTIGYFMSTLVGMVSRVIRGHSGRPVVADRWMLGAWWGVQAVVLLRLAGELMPMAGPLNLSLLAGLVWLCALGAWTGRYAPICWWPRADGRPG
jgi:uncharacterized protein involved in response to NO